MLNSTSRILAAVLATGFAADLATLTFAAEWGNLKGQFVYDGKAPAPARFNMAVQPQFAGRNVIDEGLLVDRRTLGIKNVVIYVRSKGVKSHPDYEKSANDTVVMDSNRCRFDPHVAIVRTTQTLQLHNSDPFRHNPNMSPLGDEPANPMLAPNASIRYRFQKPQKIPVPITSNIHGWMRGYVVVRDNPYVTITDAQGRFELKNLPAEELEFRVWHESSGWITARDDWNKGAFRYKLKPGDNDLGVIKIPPATFRR